MLLLGERTPLPTPTLNLVFVEEAEVRTAALDVCIAATKMRCLAAVLASQLYLVASIEVAAPPPMTLRLFVAVLRGWAMET